MGAYGTRIQIAFLVVLTAACLFSEKAPQRVEAWTLSGGAWRTDRVWHDGQAEKCVYEATRAIYGAERRYRAVAYTNKQHMDPVTATKSDDARGVEVFKHHWSEQIPTESYDYRFSTAAFVQTADLAPFKLTVSVQEDCGASFKQILRRGGRLEWFESVYFPGTGVREGRLPAGQGIHFTDALPLLLRDFPFDAPRERRLLVVPSQKENQRVPFDPVERVVRHAGEGELELPVGRVRAHELRLETPEGQLEARYWFAAEGAAPWLHALVRYEGPYGASLALASLERSAYWQR